MNNALNEEDVKKKDDTNQDSSKVDAKPENKEDAKLDSTAMSLQKLKSEILKPAKQENKEVVVKKESPKTKEKSGEQDSNMSDEALLAAFDATEVTKSKIEKPDSQKQTNKKVSKASTFKSQYSDYNIPEGASEASTKGRIAAAKTIEDTIKDSDKDPNLIARTMGKIMKRINA